MGHARILNVYIRTNTKYMNNPLISVAIPAYKSKFIKQAIDSVLNQTYINLELIIVNDKSPDDLTSIVNSYEDKRIRYYINEQNIGGQDPVANWNKCLSYANGQFFAMLCDDDLYEVSFIDEMLKLAAQFSHCNIFRGRVKIIDENCNVTNYYPTSPLFESSEDYMWHVFKGLRMQTISEFFYRTDYLKQSGSFVSLPCAWNSDYLTIFKLSQNGGIASSYKILVTFRMSGINISSNYKINNGKKLQANKQAIGIIKSLTDSDIEKYSMLKLLLPTWKRNLDVSVLVGSSVIFIISRVFDKNKYSLTLRTFIKAIILKILCRH